jgi:FkbM family methyltransferase
MPSTLHHIVGLARATGWLAALNILARRHLRYRKPVSLKVGRLSTRLEVSPTDSDLFVLSQIFGWGEYAASENMARQMRRLSAEWAASGITPVIIDGGANVGYSPLFFAKEFPEATVIALEPDRPTFERLCRNCQGERRIKPIHGALWHHRNGVRLQSGRHGSWSHHLDQEGTLVPSTTLRDVMALEPTSRLLILKLDIEGSEREVVEADPEIVRSAMCIMIEPHDFMRPGLGCLTPLFKALAGKEIDTVISGENLFLYSRELTAEAGA